MLITCGKFRHSVLQRKGILATFVTWKLGTMSFTENRIQQEGLTFDDVLLVPAWSEVLPREVSLKTQFTKNISLDIPIASAAMDTVTEAPMAIALAKEGGIGVLHKNMTAERQAEEVAKTKAAGFKVAAGVGITADAVNESPTLLCPY